MKVLKELTNIYFNNEIVTEHLAERVQRLAIYNDLLGADIEASFLVDNNHVGGLEIHTINKKGICFIYNNNTKKLITVKALRPNQYKKYYGGLGYYNGTLDSCIKNKKLGLNEV